MEKKKRRTFSKEFKLEAVRMCEDRPVGEVARRLGVHDNSLYRWQKEFAEEGFMPFEARATVRRLKKRTDV